MTKRFQSPGMKRKRRGKKKRTTDNTSAAYSQGGYRGGLVNPMAGAGTSLDKNHSSFFAPTRLQSKNINEILYVESWAAAKFVNIPVDDMFLKWREFCDMENRSMEIVQEVETTFKIKSKLAKSMKNGRLYGTGLLIILTKDSSPEMPLNINRMLPGDLANILSVDRFDANIVSKERNPYSINFGKPIFYNITMKQGGSFVVHHSRVIRFDGIEPMTENSWQSYDPDWGIPSIVPVMVEIFQDSNVSKGVAHLVNEASIAIQKVTDFEDALSGSDPDTLSLQKRMEQTTALRSIYRTVFMDAEDDFDRREISFSNLPEIMDRNAGRLAAAADIPDTRFMSKSMSGLNSTGKGEERNYALKVATDQNNLLPEPLQKIDAVIQKHAGLKEKICYKFPSILDLSEKDLVEIALKKVQIVVPAVTARILDEDEGRNILDGDPIIGKLDDLDGLIDKADEFSNRLANIQIERSKKEGGPSQSQGAQKE